MEEFPRRFVPQSLLVEDKKTLSALFATLRDKELSTTKDLEQWFLDWAELESYLLEQRARRYTAMTCHTDDPELEQAYLAFVEQVEPLWKVDSQRLREKVANLPLRGELNAARYGVLLRNIESECTIFREENVPLQVEESKLSQRYQKLCGSLVVTIDSVEHTPQQVASLFPHANRAEREKYWKLLWDARDGRHDEIDEIYTELVRLRAEIAKNAGFKNARDYIFVEYKRFDYSKEDCEKFHQSVETHVVPLARNLLKKHASRLRVPTLRPWDIGPGRLFEVLVESGNDPALTPFSNTAELLAGVRRILSEIDHRLPLMLDEMYAKEELDIENRKGKAPGAYLDSFEEIRRPFLFMNATGVAEDVQTFLHEFGHAVHCLQARQEPLVAYRNSPIEFAEVASLSMELFGLKHLEAFYKPDEASRARAKELESIILFLPYMAQIDAFQHWVYENPIHTVAERHEKWIELDSRFGPQVDWDGLETYRAIHWQQQLHLFTSPMYYIEYGIAQLGALQLWLRYRENAAEAVERYLDALSIGGAKPLPNLFEAAGASFDFSEQKVAPLVGVIRDELQNAGRL